MKKGFIGVEIILIIVIILLGLTLVHGVNPVNDSQSSIDQSATYTLDPNTINHNKDGDPALQLKSVGFIKVLPPPPADNECNEDGMINSNEPHILWAIDPDPGSSVGVGGKIKIWYNDESALPLGKPIAQVTPTDHLTNLKSLIDVNYRNAANLPIYPAIYLTDITNDPSNTSGDLEHGGTPIAPDEVWGAWKMGTGGFGSQNISSGGPNNLQLPSGADPFPAQSNVKFSDSMLNVRPRETVFGAESIWNVDGLNLTSGHSYRVEILIHDGDQTQGNDIGEACTTIHL